MKDKIQTQIDIVYNMILKYENALNKTHDNTILDDIRKKLEQEQLKFDKLKQVYPDKFI